MDESRVWDGTERRREQIGGKDGRRRGDYHCPEHHVIQESTKEHRNIVCSKIQTIKADAERDLDALKSYHDTDLVEVKNELQTKATTNDLRGIMRFISVLMTIAVLVIAGQAMWLRSDISEVSSKINRLNQRVTEGVDARVRMDLEQTKQLDDISGELRVVSWRLSQLEEAKKANNK